MKTELKIPDPVRAKEYFEDKLSYTTGPVELDRLIKENGSTIVVVDVREAEDFAKGHIPSSINLPHEQWDSLQGLQKDKVNILYCYTQTCHLAANAAVRFAERGYPVMEMDGGFEAWKEAELEVEKEPINRLRRTTSRLLHRH